MQSISQLTRHIAASVAGVAKDAMAPRSSLGKLRSARPDPAVLTSADPSIC